MLEGDDESSSREPSDDDLYDSDESNRRPLPNEVFQRVDTRANAVSRRSLLTWQIRENDRKSALQRATSRSTPETRRPHTPYGPPGSSPQKNNPQGSALPSSVTAPISQGSVLDPASCRRSMLDRELGPSLQAELLRERKDKKRTISAVLKRSGSSYPPTKRNCYNDYFDAFRDYHGKGW